MKHAWKKLLAAAVLPCLLAGCGALGGPESEVPSMDHLLGLTQEQRLEDYDYLVQTLGDSYLCMGVRDRDNPEDPSAAIFQAYREMIQEYVLPPPPAGPGLAPGRAVSLGPHDPQGPGPAGDESIGLLQKLPSPTGPAAAKREGENMQ